jgi:c-di-AMP phosphodiesterase-like protein
VATTSAVNAKPTTTATITLAPTILTASESLRNIGLARTRGGDQIVADTQAR